MKKASHKSSAPVLNNRTLEKDYATLVPLLKEGLRVLDVGCGTGAISKGIAEKVGTTGQVIGIDRSKALIEEGKALFDFPTNLELIITGLFEYEPKEKFDLIVAARVLQWLDNPQGALAKMKTWLKPNGQISILDYNHEALAWTPAPPKSMQTFYQGFLDWRSSLGLNNAIAADLPDYFGNIGLQHIEIIPSNEVYNKGEENFLHKAGIWIEVAKNVGEKMVTGGFVTEQLRLKAMKEHQHWIETDAKQMIMKLKEVRGIRKQEDVKELPFQLIPQNRNTATKRAEMPKGSAPILNYRSLEKDYATLIPLLKEGIRVLDVGCGTGAITIGIAKKIGERGQVIGLDSSEHLIKEGKDGFDLPNNLELVVGDLFSYEPVEKFDLIVSARVLQWLNNPKAALAKLKTLLKPGGQISILDYNHEELEWTPEPPKSMQQFYGAFLKWKREAGMNNRIAETLPSYFEELEFNAIESINANEVYQKGAANFLPKIGIWTKVAESRGLQMQKDGYITNELRVRAIEEYNEWIQTKAEQMVMKLNDVRGVV